MSTTTITLPEPHPQIPIRIPPASAHTSTLSSAELTSFPAFRTWLSTLSRSLALQQTSPHPFRPSPYSLKSITINSITRFGGKRVGFMNITAEIRNAENESLPGSILLRGGSVAMLVLLQPDDVPADSETDKHVLLAVQPRIPAGSLGMVELPAGMLDDSGSFAVAAAKEIEEECQLTIAESELVDMTALAMLEENEEGLQKSVYMSPGGCDEFIPCFCAKSV